MHLRPPHPFHRPAILPHKQPRTTAKEAVFLFFHRCWCVAFNVNEKSNKQREIIRQLKKGRERARERQGGGELASERQRWEKVRSHAAGMLEGRDCWRDCPIFHSHNQSQLSERSHRMEEQGGRMGGGGVRRWEGGQGLIEGEIIQPLPPLPSLPPFPPSPCLPSLPPLVCQRVLVV